MSERALRDATVHESVRPGAGMGMGGHKKRQGQAGCTPAGDELVAFVQTRLRETGKVPTLEEVRAHMGWKGSGLGGRRGAQLPAPLGARGGAGAARHPPARGLAADAQSGGGRLTGMKTAGVIRVKQEARPLTTVSGVRAT